MLLRGCTFIITSIIISLSLPFQSHSQEVIVKQLTRWQKVKKALGIVKGEEGVQGEKKFKYGAGIVFGTATIKNKGGIEKFYQALEESNNGALKLGFNQKTGGFLGPAFFGVYRPSKILNIDYGIDFFKQHNKIELYSEYDSANGGYQKTSSIVDIKVSSFRIPLGAKIRFLTVKQSTQDGATYPTIRLGIQYDYRFSKKMDAFENQYLYDARNDKMTTQGYSFTKRNIEGLNESAFGYSISTGFDFTLIEFDESTFIFEIGYSGSFFSDRVSVADLSSTTDGKNFVHPPFNTLIFDENQQTYLSEDYGQNVSRWRNSKFFIKLAVIF